MKLNMLSRYSIAQLWQGEHRCMRIARAELREFIAESGVGGLTGDDIVFESIKFEPEGIDGSDVMIRIYADVKIITNRSDDL